MIEVQLNHAELCDHIANRTMAEKQKGWDTERVALLRKIRGTASQPAKSAEQCWKCGDLDPAGHAKCNVPACGMREDTQPARREPLTDEEIDKLDCIPNVPGIHFGDVVDFARAIERAHGIGEQP